MKRDFLNRILFAPAEETPNGSGDSTGDKGDKPDDKSDGKGDDDDEPDPDDLDENETENAKNLFKALKDPKKASVIIRALAEDAGIKLDGTKADKREAKNDLISVLKEHLGDDYGWLADKLGPALEKALNDRDQKHSQREQEREARELERETDEALDYMYREYKDFKLFEKPMQRLLKEYNPAPGQSQKQFLIRMYKLAKTEAGERTNEKRDKNRRDVTLRTTSTGGKDTNNQRETDRPTRRQAIERAWEKIQEESQD